VFISILRICEFKSFGETEKLADVGSSKLVFPWCSQAPLSIGARWLVILRTPPPSSKPQIARLKNSLQK